jgi:type IV pilus assembly protein PilM
LFLKRFLAKLTKFFNLDGYGDDRNADGSVFAIDIGSSFIKVMTGRRDGGQIIVDNYNKIPAPSFMNKISYFEDIARDIEAINTKLEILLENFAAESDYLIICLPDNFSIVKLLSLEKTPAENELEAVIKKNIEADLPQAYEMWDFTTDIVDCTDNGINMIVLATLKRNLENVIDMVSDSLAEPDYVSCSSFLAQEILYPYIESRPGANIALVNMGNTVTSVSIFKGTHLRFMQNIYIGGYNFTLDVANAMQMSTSEAENFKKNEIFFLPEYAPQQEKVKNYTAIKSTFMELARGIFYFFESYFTKYFEEKIDEIIIYGGGANFKNIEVTLGGMLNIPVKKASSVIKVKNAEGGDLEEEKVNACLSMLGAISGGSEEENEDKT